MAPNSSGRVCWAPLLVAACALLFGCRDSDRAVSPGAPAPAPGGAASRVSARVSPSAPSLAPAKREPELARPYNVLLIMIDSLRWDMPWSGYPRPITPRLSALSKRCTLYPRAYALSSYTAKSVAPALVGKYGSEMPRDGMFFTRWPDSNLFISERAQAAGHRTLSGQGHGYFMPQLGLNQGYDDYRLLEGTFLDVTGVHDVTSERLNALAKQMLAQAQPAGSGDAKRFFAYFHFLDPHHSYILHQGHPNYGSGRRDLYDNEVHYTDHWVGDLIDFVSAQPWAQQTALIITADHGEGFGEHGHYRHSYEVWEALVRVPWMICLPGVPGRRIEAPRGHIDLAPTIADLMGLPNDPPLRGVSLLPEVLGGPVRPRPVLVDLPRADLMDRRRALIDGPHKLIAFGDDQRFELYEVVSDPREERELSQAQPALLERMQELYRTLSAAIPTQPIVGGARLQGAPAGRPW